MVIPRMKNARSERIFFDRNIFFFSLIKIRKIKEGKRKIVDMWLPKLRAYMKTKRHKSLKFPFCNHNRLRYIVKEQKKIARG